MSTIQQRPPGGADRFWLGVLVGAAAVLILGAIVAVVAFVLLSVAIGGVPLPVPPQLLPS